jgi:hypothetical protein
MIGVRWNDVKSSKRRFSTPEKCKAVAAPMDDELMTTEVNIVRFRFKVNVKFADNELSFYM